VEVFRGEFDSQVDIQAASLYSENELVILTHKGIVFIYSCQTWKSRVLFETNPEHGAEYRDGGFDPSAKTSIYTMDDVVVVTNDYKTHGFVLNLKENYLVDLWRKDYLAEASKYPIALFMNEKGEPCLIFGAAWNQIQVANLTSRQILTADKSLIEEDAEQQYIETYKKYKTKMNKLFWPNEYDYFYGRLILSPDKKKFLSAGWEWGSCNCYKLYDVNDFISNRRIKDVTVGRFEHNDRAVCFVDNDTVAVIFDPNLDGLYQGDNQSGNAPYEIRLYHSDGRGEKRLISITESLDLDGAELVFDQRNQCFYTFSGKIGMAVISLGGEIVFHEPAFIPQIYDERHGRFISYDKRQLSVHKLE